MEMRLKWRGCSLPAGVAMVMLAAGTKTTQAVGVNLHLHWHSTMTAASYRSTQEKPSKHAKKD